MTTVHLVVPAGIDNPSRPSGGNYFDRRIATALAAGGWHVVEHHLPGSWPRPAPCDAGALPRLLAGLPDGAVVLVDSLVALASAVPAATAARVRLVVLVHMLLASADDVGPRLALERAALRQAAAVVTTSDWTRDKIVARHGVPPQGILVLEPGTDRGPVAQGTSGGGALLCVAAVTANKGHGVLIDALAEVAGLDWSCSFAGAADLEPGLMDKLRQQAEDAGIAERLHWSGPLTRADLGRRYTASDALILASQQESYGMVVAEALAHGLPALASNTGGVPEALGKSSSGSVPGLLVPPGDRAALAGALRRWLEDAVLRRSLREAALERRDTLPSWDAAAATLAGLLEPLATTPERAKVRH
ncbi:Glycosyltransferase involved in cell wall bisynthesis [Arthrobacter alpinus]|uniref:Glycosyltransferase involved in cell wall bisynthesis n=1 Tax=Arthrobacter alpinus TaxID=656366 RepID=A0A1H5K514_9MICC|nr:glycosyltransferase family 4 protein [Arthrobacter alpinus]SEE59111.1 Glycosyltransferase involved in cell wall bisynthesis [Arthrobacter alpinus]